jgi:single-stranded-DNA-specific exonuclease
VHRPVVAFAPAEPGSPMLRGSARSIPGLHIRDLLAAIDTTAPGLIARFGGHATAAGMSLAEENLTRFREALHAAVTRMLDPALLHEELLSDGELDASDFCRNTAELLRDAGPWGQAYPEPMFDGTFDLLAWRVVGERHLKLELAGMGTRLNAIEFGGWRGEQPPQRLRIAFRLAPDDYRGGEAIQLLVVHREPA